MRLIDWAYSKGEYFVQLLQTDGKYKGNLEKVRLNARQAKLIASTKIFALMDVTFMAENGQNVLRSSLINRLHESCVDANAPIANPFLTQAFPSKRAENRIVLEAINAPVHVLGKDSKGQVFSYRGITTRRIGRVTHLGVKVALDGMNKTWTMLLPTEAYTKGTDKYIDRFCNDGMAPKKEIVDFVRKLKSGDQIFVTYKGMVGQGVSYKIETAEPAIFSVPCDYLNGKAGKYEGKPTLFSSVKIAGKGPMLTMLLRPEGSEIPTVFGQMKYAELVKALDDMDKGEQIHYSRLGGKLWINAVGELELPKAKEEKKLEKPAKKPVKKPKKKPKRK